MAEIRDYEKKKYKKRHENNSGGACKNDGKLMSSVNTIEPSANLVAATGGYLHYLSLYYCILLRNEKRFHISQFFH